MQLKVSEKLEITERRSVPREVRAAAGWRRGPLFVHRGHPGVQYGALARRRRHNTTVLRCGGQRMNELWNHNKIATQHENSSSIVGSTAVVGG